MSSVQFAQRIAELAAQLGQDHGEEWTDASMGQCSHDQQRRSRALFPMLFEVVVATKDGRKVLP